MIGLTPHSDIWRALFCPADLGAPDARSAGSLSLPEATSAIRTRLVCGMCGMDSWSGELAYPANMDAIERYKKKNKRHRRRIFWALIFVLIFALVAPYLWFDELREWVDSLGIGITITKEIDR